MSQGVRAARPVELGIATAVLVAFGLAAAVAGLLARTPARSPPPRPSAA
ncbi:hypothetical protein [Umezawaea sp. Da 62-37]|nr:hypothetical protein [Umezawaea sp. Da 62-37]WNV90965.1 hypothetical protein RM788_22600 [Umezawaea sp. Da 62-37]